MRIEPLPIAGAFVVTPRQFSDHRGTFLEGFRADLLARELGHTPTVRQTNVTVSSCGTLRGIHVTVGPWSQAKYVTALTGSVLDLVIDARVGSPTFREWASVLLDTTDRRAVYLSEGLGHATLALEHGATVHYLCSQPYRPEHELGIYPLDPWIDLPVPPDLTPIMSKKDRAAPTLREVQDSGLLPRYTDSCGDG